MLTKITPASLAGLLLVLSSSFTQSTLAVPITDTVTVNGVEWAQVDLFTSLTWNDINAVCPSGNCDAGSAATLNTFDMDSWTWATAAFVGDALFGPLTVHAGGVSDVTVQGDHLSPFLAATLLRITFRTSLSGMNADLSNDGKAGVSYISHRVFNVYPPDSVTTIGTSNGLQADLTGTQNYRGAWFYRSPIANVPEPGSLALFGLGLAGLGISRRKRYTNC